METRTNSSPIEKKIFPRQLYLIYLSSTISGCNVALQIQNEKTVFQEEVLISLAPSGR
jgi:hypothetical protein